MSTSNPGHHNDFDWSDKFYLMRNAHETPPGNYYLRVPSNSPSKDDIHLKVAITKPTISSLMVISENNSHFVSVRNELGTAVLIDQVELIVEALPEVAHRRRRQVARDLLLFKHVRKHAGQHFDSIGQEGGVSERFRFKGE